MEPINWLAVHINTLVIELYQIRTAVHIFKVVDKEWDRRVKDKDVPEYSEVRTMLYESLVYRTFLGLSKIFSNSREQSLLKATNHIEQLKLNGKGIQSAISEIREKLLTSQMVKTVHTYRDKFFAHLDKENVLSYCRIDPTSLMTYIDIDEVDEWLCLVRNFYEACFQEKLSYEHSTPSDEDIIYTFFWR